MNEHEPLSIKNPERDKWSAIRFTVEVLRRTTVDPGELAIVVQVDDAYTCHSYDLTVDDAVKVRDWLTAVLQTEIAKISSCSPVN